MTPITYRYCRFPPALIQHAAWLYARFTLSFRGVEDLPAERAIEVSYETIRRRVARFGPHIARRLRHHRPRPHAQWHLDELFVSIDGKPMYLWRAIDQNGEILDGLVQAKRDERAAPRFLSLHAATYNVLNTRRHLNSAANHRDCRRQAFATWREAADIAAQAFDAGAALLVRRRRFVSKPSQSHREAAYRSAAFLKPYAVRRRVTRRSS